MRQPSLLDRVLVEIDQSLRTVHARPPVTERPNPARQVTATAALDDTERRLSGRLMRVNHAGEIAAQGLYRGQALTARLEGIRAQMQRAADEENDHLDWCEQRLQQLDSHKSRLNPVWYWGSFSLGALAGLAGDRWSLGFVKETEDQVEQHLKQHLGRLPANDLPSLAIVKQMQEDERHHGDQALAAGGKRLPWPIRRLAMPLAASIMTTLSARI
ncbi:MAG: 2-polyprenyl-3-methyl-6-methoxy-1,4-benzoquinone monooxygenase [Thiothrix sp.]|nr:2-polyprenyl-3-methyl-6-methoxy-1,4-benzoquinone monooxygenase [Thiothrix sp.]